VKEVWDVVRAVCGWFYHWQTLVGALLALAAAWWTIRIMRKQMQAEEERHRHSLLRKKMAARAQMPDALSGLSAYVRGCGDRIKGATDTLPDEPVAAVSALKQVIEFIDDDAAARTFQLVSWYQVFRARDMHDVPNAAHPNFPERLYDAALLQAYINSLYDYARNEADEVDTAEPSRDDMIDGLKNAFDLVYMAGHRELFVGVYPIIERRHKPAS
jgi:hypothetical protein